MEQEKPQNPNAFPTRTEFDDPTNPKFSGMSLRDYFAAKAMQAIINTGRYTWVGVAQTAYHIADAMLLHREK